MQNDKGKNQRVNNKLILYKTEDGQSRIEVRLENETVWLNQKQMAELFQTTIPNINQHINNIIKEGELGKNSTIKKSLIVQKEGGRDIKREDNLQCLIVDKSIIRSEELKSNKNSFYAYFIKEVLKKSNDTIFDAKVRMDGSGNRIFRKNFFTYLRRELNTSEKKIMRNCRMVDSKRNVLVQLADMVAGSLNRAQSKKKQDSQIYRNIIKNHIEDEWRFR